MNERDTEIVSVVYGSQWTMQDMEFAALIRADEREAIAQMFERTPALIPFAQNDKGGCMICGFTPKLAVQAIRARATT